MRSERVETEFPECIFSSHLHKRGGLASLRGECYFPSLKFPLPFFRVPLPRHKNTYCPQRLTENTHDMICHTSQFASVWSEYERAKLCGIAQIA